MKQGTIGWQWHQLDHMHLALDRQPRQHLITQYFPGQMLFLTPNRQYQSKWRKATEQKPADWDHLVNGC